MKITFLRSMLMAAVIVGGLSLTSCKEKTSTEVDTEMETTMDGDTTTTVTETEVDAPGAAHDTTMTDTVTKVK
ncbi:hypothetical protein [Flavobacterium suzhouense]|uniref:Uncharacterized protein n=1 Tax=Flavobacterium suzhouense TaxID=1529638 RepID=A0ABW5NZB0_9FLAO